MKTFIPSVRVQLMFNGNLEMSLNPRTQAWVKKHLRNLHSFKAEKQFVNQFLVPLGYKQIMPEDCGALTQATLITDGKNVWGDMNYQIRSFLEELVNGRSVIWSKG